LKRDFRSCTLNDKEISAEEFDELWNKLLVFLDDKCERVDEADYGVADQWWVRVGMYKCDNNKIGLFMKSTEGFDRIVVYTGENAWKRAKEDAIDDINDKIEWLEPSGNDEMINYLNDTLDEIKHMPE
jgi:hypothetical protein